jgi:hypothetical protein
MQCKECRTRTASEYIDAKRLKACKPWIFKRYPMATVCMRCFEKNHPEEYAEHLKRNKEIEEKYAQRNRDIKYCIEFTIANVGDQDRNAQDLKYLLEEFNSKLGINHEKQN